MKTLSRRNFIGNSSVALAGLTIVPSRVVSGLGHIVPSDKLNVAGIGVGNRGNGNLRNLTETGNVNIVALCDVDWNKEVGIAFNTYAKAKRYKDFRIMLDTQKDIDAVMIATPDHTHAVISMAAIRRGKHVYTEKPLTKTVYESRMLARAAKEYKVATQMGNIGQADDGPRRLREMIWDGVIGPVHEVHVWTDRPNKGLFGSYWPQGIARSQDILPVPESLDWDLFIGPAPMRPYHSDYHPFKWRGWWDFGSGALGDIACHVFDPIFRALRLKYPTSVQAVSTPVNDETYPLGSIVTYDFPGREGMPELRLVWYDGGLRPAMFRDLDEGMSMGVNGGTLYIGSEGKIFGNRILPKSLRESYKIPDPYIPSSPGHYQEWILACKGGAVPPGSNFEWAGPLTETVQLGNIALRRELRKKLSSQPLKFDHEKLCFPNMPEADKFLQDDYREGWEL